MLIKSRGGGHLQPAPSKTTSGFSQAAQLKICFLQAVEQQLARRSTYRSTDAVWKWKHTREKAKNSAGPIHQDPQPRSLDQRKNVSDQSLECWRDWPTWTN